MFRLLVLLDEIPSYHIIFQTAKALAYPFATLLGVLFILFFFTAQIGVAIFGGIIYKDNPLLTNILEHYECNNFNDMASAFVTLFELLVVNNWQFIVVMYSETTQSKLARLYFIIFYFLGVIVSLNICVAFVLDMFNSQMELKNAQKGSHKERAEVALQKQRSLITRLSQREKKHEKNQREQHRREEEPREEEKHFMEDDDFNINQSFKDHL
jgi:hypothetical protein